MTTPIERIKARWTAADILRTYGAGIQRAARPGVNVPCPGPSHTRGDKVPGLRVYSDGRWHCHGCGERGDAVDLFRLLTGATLGEALATLDAGEVPTLPAPAAEPTKESTPAPVPLDMWPTWRAAQADAPALDAWLAARGIPAGKVEGLDLVRLLDAGAAWPRSWAHYGRRVIVPIWTHAGELAGFRGRFLPGFGEVVMPDGKKPEKERLPKGVRMAGRVLACPLGRAMLRGEAAPARVVIVEGVPDYLTAAACFGNGDVAPAVLGVANGAWSAEIAARVPVGALVTLAPHADEEKPDGKTPDADWVGPGAAMMAPIGKELRARGCAVTLRSDARATLGKDLNDVAQARGLSAVCALLWSDENG